MDNIELKKLKQTFSTLSNEKRLRIIELCSNRGYSITELSKLLKLNYSITVEYTSMLEKANLVIKERNQDKTVTVKSLIRIKNDGQITRV